jgi:uncharacterized protein
MNHLATLALTLCLLVLPTQAQAQPRTAMPSGPQGQQPQQKGKLVFVAMTGMEDIVTLASSFRHAAMARQSGHLEEVVWLAWGRAVGSLNPKVAALPEEVRKHAAAAKAAGVRMVVCGHALRQYGIDPAALQPQVEVVEGGVVELSRLVAEGYQIIRY